MASLSIDATGTVFPEPLFKIASQCGNLEPGDTLEVTADCPSFEQDVRSYCRRLGKKVLWVRKLTSGALRVAIQF